jgi:hypothetical protein
LQHGLLGARVKLLVLNAMRKRWRSDPGNTGHVRRTAADRPPLQESEAGEPRATMVLFTD